MNSEKPVFQQIIEMIENEIMKGTYAVDDAILSTTEIAKLLSVNPNTAVKAVSILADKGVVYKKRGVGMFVAEGAKEKISSERRSIFLNQSLPLFLKEAETLGLSESELIAFIKERTHDKTK